MRLYRIAQDRYPVLDGGGAKLSGGRWNSVGLPVVYTSSTRALAALEKLVWVDPEDLPANLRLFELNVPDQVSVEVLPMRALPANWRQAGDLECRNLGDQWLSAGRSLLLAVPSAIIPEEPNYLINPMHRDIEAVQVAHVREFVFDVRLLGQRVWTGKLVSPPPLP